MIIQRLDLKAYGRFSNVSLDLSAGPHRFHLIYGANESGKTTSLRAITALFYGMPHRTDDNYLHNNTQLRVGGLLLGQDGTRLECVRRRGRKATLRDADDNEPIDEAQLRAMLGGVDKETFLTRFGLSHQELVRGGAAIIAGQGDLGEILFAAGAGVSGLREIQSQLVQARDALFVPRGNREINRCIKQLEESRKQLRGLQVQPTTFMDLQKRIEQQRATADELARKSQQLTVKLQQLLAYQQAIPLLPRWKADQQKLASLFNVKILDEAFIQRHREADTQRQLAIKLHETTTARLNQLTKQLQSLPVDAAVLQHETEIESVFQQLAARDKADHDRSDLMRVRRNLDRKILDLLQQLSIPVTKQQLESGDAVDEAIAQLKVTDSMRARIHELAAGHENVIRQREDAESRLKTLQQKHDDVSAQLRELPAPADPAALSGVIDEMGSPATLLESLQQQTAVCERIQAQCEDHLRNLVGFNGDCKSAVRLQIPPTSVVEQLATELEKADDSAGAAKKGLASLQAKREQLSRRLSQEAQKDPLPTFEQLKEARKRRDEIVQALREKTDEQERLRLIDTLADHIAKADEIADTIRGHHQKVHQRSADQANLTAVDREISDQESNAEAAINRFAHAQDQWEGVWRTVGVVANSPQKMRRWIHDHEKLVASFNQLQQEEERRDQLRQRIDRATSRLRAVLDAAKSSAAVSVGSNYVQTGLFDPPPGGDHLESLHDEAVALRGELAARRQELETLRRRRTELSEEIPAAKTRLASSQQNAERWNTDWHRVTDWLPDQNQASPNVLVPMLSRIDDLCAKKREHDILCSRIRSIGEDEEKYSARVARLAGILKADLGEDVGAVARSMFARLQNERSSLGKRASIENEIEQLKQRLTESSSQQSQYEAVLHQLCAEAGADSPDQLPELESKSRERAKVETSLRDLENQLSLLAGEESIESFVESVRSQQPAQLAQQIQEKQAELDQARDNHSKAQQEIGALQHEIDSISGSDRAADLNQSIQLTAGKLDRDAQEYARLKIASMIMQQAIEHYRRENQSPVLAFAEQMFCRLTCGEYTGLKVDYDAKGNSILFGQRGSGDSDVPVSLMSVGTADALYLALRLASLKHQLGHTQPIPLVIDDCLIQLDDDRAAAALKLLAELSLTTQVILFTHHRHLVDLAGGHLEKEQFHVHEI